MQVWTICRGITHIFGGAFLCAALQGDVLERKNPRVADTRIFGVSGGTRTPDPQLRRLLLYPTELLRHD